MSTKRFALCFVFLSYLFSGCTASSVTQSATAVVTGDSIRDFDFVTLDAPGVLEIFQGDIESLEINGDPDVASSITARITDRKLVISSKNDLSANVSLTYKLFVKNLTGVLLDEFSVVKIPAYTSETLELTINGPGRIDIGDLTVANLKLVINGDGNIEADSIRSTKLTVSSINNGSVNIAAGDTVDLSLELGSGLFFGADFKGANVTINMNGSGTAQVWAVDNLDVRIDGSGKVTYYGEPTLSMSIKGGGQLTGGGNK